MVRQVFSGSVIHADEGEAISFQQWAAIFVEDGRVFNIFYILLLLFFCFISNSSNINKI